MSIYNCYSGDLTIGLVWYSNVLPFPRISWLLLLLVIMLWSGKLFIVGVTVDAYAMVEITTSSE